MSHRIATLHACTHARIRTHAEESRARTKKRIRPLVNGKGWEYLVLYDDNQNLKRALNITTLPHTLVLKNNKIIHRRTGYTPGIEDELFEIIKENSN